MSDWRKQAAAGTEIMKYKPATRLQIDLNIENEEVYVGDLAWTSETTDLCQRSYLNDVRDN